MEGLPSINAAYADGNMKIYTAGEVTWIHGYRLLIPQIRQAPWPLSKMFRILSRRNQLVNGTLASNTAGTHAETHKEHFVSCCKRLDPHEG
jgi:trehalose 6-phosphate synthase/phosphatase